MTQSTDTDHEQFRSYLYLLARSHLGPNTAHRIDASDLVQQTLLDAHANRIGFRGTTEAERAAWLRRILTHNLTDALRHQHRGKRDVSRQQSLEAEIDGSFRQVDSWLTASQQSPSQNVMQKEELLRLADAIAALPDAQREAVMLRHLRGMSLAEVSSQLDRSEAAVAGLLYRGLSKLHHVMNDEGEE